MIAIKDFKMPDNCLKCPMQFGGWCYVSPPDVDERVAPTVDDAREQEKPEWCPLVEVPDVNIGKCSEIPNASTDCIRRQDVIDKFTSIVPYAIDDEYTHGYMDGLRDGYDVILELPSVQPEQRYTEEELRVFQHGISLSLLSKRSSQYWQYDEDMATEIKFLERLYEKVGADMRTKKADYERAVEQLEHDMLYEPTFNQDDGSM